jgi:glycosyltransferase involved in cell wall biosynthesis
MKIAIVAGDDLVADDPQQLCAALAARGHESIAYVRQRSRRSTEMRSEGDCRVVSIGVGPPAPKTGADVLPYLGDWAATLEREWSSQRPDVVHAYGWLGGLAAQLAARRRRIPTVQSFHGLAATSGGGRHPAGERERIEPLLARGAAWVTAECAADVDALARLRRSRARLCSLGSGIDVERYTPVGPAEDRAGLHRVLCLAPNPLPANGFDIAIRALLRVAGTELVVAETGTDAPAHDEARALLKDLATDLAVAERVRFAGTVDADRLPALLRSADVVACTPRRPPRATSVLQAMASGVAVVTLPVGVLPDIVVNAVTGLVVSERTPAAVAAALRGLLAQSFQCESMGAAGRSRAVSRFTWDRVALDSLNIYRQAATSDATPVSGHPGGALALS